MENAAPRFAGSNLPAACIVAAALIGAALIITSRAPAVERNLTPAMAGSAPMTKVLTTPPINQASAQEQFRNQVLAAPSLHTLQRDGKAYSLQDVKVERVVYTAKDDTFTIVFNWLWQPALSANGPPTDYVTLNNDGYGHYYGSVGGQMVGFDKNADVTIK